MVSQLLMQIDFVGGDLMPSGYKNISRDYLVFTGYEFRNSLTEHSGLRYLYFDFHQCSEVISQPIKRILFESVALKVMYN